ncbi:rhodanese family protein [Pantoea sp. JGM49]|uniref:rhodanese family protein n=1 Tax=Pantoea sp. JGM49 TaxID=2799791 RepID=UPI001BA8270A|nr:rhodanese family protein [Pantoea sp. JGM49]MBS0883641.1 rhodanese family protein [Pantoea sp. JGM49]
MNIPLLTPIEVKERLKNGARLIDIRGRDEWEYEHIPEALSVPIGEIEPEKPLSLRQKSEDCIIFHCQTGMRTDANQAQCATLGAPAKIYLLKGGMNAWKSAGYATVKAKGGVLPLMRQVQIAAGTLVLTGVLAGATVSEWCYLVSGIVGCGLIFAGITGWCGMAKVLSRLPWNRT